MYKVKDLWRYGHVVKSFHSMVCAGMPTQEMFPAQNLPLVGIGFTPETKQLIGRWYQN